MLNAVAQFEGAHHVRHIYLIAITITTLLEIFVRRLNQMVNNGFFFIYLRISKTSGEFKF